MAVTDAKIHPNSKVAIDTLRFTDTLAINLTNVAVARFDPGYRFEILAVRASARTVNSFTVPEVRIVDAAANTGTNVLSAALTPSAVASATPAVGALITPRTARRGGATQEILLHVTTGGTAPVNVNIEIDIRPFPLNGEA